MAPADAGDYVLDEEDDDFFAELNPHPYRGGYDLAATYGSPLSPSANTCYPVSSSSAAAAAAIPPTLSATPEPTDPPQKEPNEDGEEAPPEPVYKSPEFFRNGAWTEGKVRRGRSFGRGFWRKCVRVLDFIFCYSDPYGERRIEVDSYVVPVYANRKEGGEDALAMEVEAAQPAVGRVEVHDPNEELVEDNDLSWHSDYRDETSIYSQPMYNSCCRPSAQSHGLPGFFDKPDLLQNFSFSGSHQAEESNHEVSLSYDLEHRMSGQPVSCYHNHCYEPPSNVQIEPPEPVSSQKFEYYEHFSTYFDQRDIHILETPTDTYEVQPYTEISRVQLQPFKPSWSQDWGLYHAYTQGDALGNDTHSPISGEYGNIGSLLISPFYPQEADGTYNMNGSFWPFGEDPIYSV